MTVKKHVVDLNKAIGKPYSQQPGRKHGEGAGHISNEQEYQDILGRAQRIKEAKNRRFSDTFDKAHEAGMAALKGSTPTPMIVQEHSNQLDDNSPVKKEYFVEGGACGFAWVNLAPANHSFVKWVREKDKSAGKSGSLAYEGGYNVWVGEGGQSMQRKEAYANAFADVVQKEFPNLKVNVGSRMD